MWERRKTLEFYHGGCFVRIPNRVWVGRSVSWVDDFPINHMSYFELQDFVLKLGYENSSDMYYYVPRLSLDDGLEVIRSDSHVRDMVLSYKDQNTIQIYIVPSEPLLFVIYLETPTKKDQKDQPSEPTQPSQVGHTVNLGEDDVKDLVGFDGDE
ncbi:hypothetical protein REPUB_Repub20aG0049000 [Reevesia pubescens]